MKKALLTIVSGVFVLLGTMQAQITHSIAVNRYSSATLTDIDAKRILADATTILQQNDGAGDVSCNVTFSLSGSVGTFSAGNGIINSAADYQKVCQQSGRIHIVNEINWCGGVTPSPGNIFIGCSDTPGACMIMVRLAASNEESVCWTHEFGHNQGLGHRDADFAVMNSVVAADHKRVNATECAAFAKQTMMAATESVQPSSKEAEPHIEKKAGPMSIKDFVHQRFLHGVPFKEASAYPQTATTELLDMLVEPTEEAYYSNIILTICMIGDAGAVDDLIAFFNKGEGKLNMSVYNAKKAVLMGLGYIVNKSGSEKALRFLLEAVKPEYWAKRKIHGRRHTIYQKKVFTSI